MKPGSVALEVVALGEGGVTEADLLVHDETSRIQAQMLAEMEPPAFPVALGVLYCNPGASYETDVRAQREAVKASKSGGDLKALLHSGHTWTVGA